jgi:hypothetical protein
VVPLAVAADGRSFFAEIWSKAYSGVVQVDSKTSRYKKIKAFPDPANDQASGDFDGRWLVWDEYHSLYNTDDYTVWSWDSRTGLLRKIGAASRSPSGEFYPNSLRAPVALDGYATWEQGGPNNLGEIHVVKLKTGRDRIVYRGHVDAPFLIKGHRVVWPESMKPGALTILRTAKVKTGRIVITPKALKKVRGGIWPSSDGDSLMYVTNKQRALWWSPSLDVLPKLVFTARTQGAIWIPLDKSSRGITAFTIPYHTYLANTDSRRYVEITAGSLTHIRWGALVTFGPGGKTKKKANHPIKDIAFLPLKSLPPIPRCK